MYVNNMSALSSNALSVQVGTHATLSRLSTAASLAADASLIASKSISGCFILPGKESFEVFEWEEDNVNEAARFFVMTHAGRAAKAGYRLETQNCGTVHTNVDHAGSATQAAQQVGQRNVKYACQLNYMMSD